jgi:feruloyl esterase
MLTARAIGKFGLYLVALYLPLGAATCDSLASLKLPNTFITAAHVVTAGTFQPPGPAPTAALLAAYQTLPAFCRVQGVIEPTSDSQIEFEVWLPTENWNGRFQAVGNGGWAGFINYRDLVTALQTGYATASTDTGHKGSNAEFAVGHPEKLIDFAHRGVHETAVHSKSIVTAFYGRPAQYSYWNSCSAGGGQGVMEAWRYPDDFDGIIAGAVSRPLNMGLIYGWIAAAQAVRRTPGSFIPASKYPVIHQAVMRACDSIDGLEDGLIQDPTRCRFDPGTLRCKGADQNGCLTVDQVAAARQLYAPVVNPRTKKMIYPGLQPGSELGWGTVAGPQPFSVGPDTLKYLFFKDHAWDFRTLDMSSYEEVESKLGAGNNPMNADVHAFLKKGGKLLVYHGWNDTVVAPGEGTRFYEGVLRAEGNTAKTTDAVRLFMAPGMGHCGGGEGPNRFNAVAALEVWVEKGKAPDSIVASHAVDGKVDRTRPLCPYPRVAVYKGSGSIDDAANFICRVP